MSFAYTAKMEVLNNKIENDCCSIAFLSAIIKTAGEISLDNQHNLKVEILTELESLFERTTHDESILSVSPSPVSIV